MQGRGNDRMMEALLDLSGMTKWNYTVGRVKGCLERVWSKDSKVK